MTTTVPASMLSGVTSATALGADSTGVADSTTAIQAAITAAPNGTALFFPAGTYKLDGQLTVTGKTQLRLVGERGTKLLFTDRAGIGLLFTGTSGQCVVENMMIHGTNTSTPTITLVKVTGNSAYFTMQDCQLSYASVGMLLAQTYIVKLTRNNWANCDRFVQTISGEGSSADMALDNETFGTTTIGTNAAIDVASGTMRITGSYFETQGHTKDSVVFQTGAGRGVLSGCVFENSGRVRVATSALVAITGNAFQDTYASGSCIRADASSSAAVTNNVVNFASIVAGVTGVSVSTALVSVCGNNINKAETGIGSAGTGTVVGNLISNCTTGLSLTSGGLGVAGMNCLVSNTTDLANTNGTNIVALNMATAVTTGASTGALFGNSPWRTYVRELTNGVTVDPASVATGAGLTGTISVTGAAVGDFVTLAFSNSLAGLDLTGYVSAADTVTWLLQNVTGGAVDLASGTLRAVVRKST